MRQVSQLRLVSNFIRAPSHLALAMMPPRGWELKHYAEGLPALEELSSDTHYDLLLVDFTLPDLSGLELIERVRGMFHRRYLPVVIMSGTLDEAAAREAGADAFLQKPHGLSSVVETISRLLDERKESSD